MNALERLSSMLGDDIFFVPCEWGTKEPLVTYVERPFEGTKTEAYRALFEAEPTNIANPMIANNRYPILAEWSGRSRRNVFRSDRLR